MLTFHIILFNRINQIVLRALVVTLTGQTPNNLLNAIRYGFELP